MNSIYSLIRSQSSTKSSAPLRFFLLQSSYSFSSSTNGKAATVSKKKKPPPPPPSSLSSSPCEWPRPKEIPYQPKVSNFVNLIGYVSEPIQSQSSSSPDNKFWAATVLTQDLHHPPRFWIPIIFEGDLAHAATNHLKVNDRVFISGQLSADPPPFDLTHQGQAQVRIMVQDINFIEVHSHVKETLGDHEKERHFLTEQQEEQPAKDSAIAKDVTHAEQAWKDILMWPHQWWDIRSQDNPNGAAFERKINGELLCIDHTTPKWIQEKLEVMIFDKKTIVKGQQDNITRNGDSLLNSWKELHNNPKQWWDYRSSKLNGLVNPKHPDFKSKNGDLALWLDRAPKWILAELDKLEFDVQITKPKQVNQQKGDACWTDLVDNPKKWWDNRINKKYVKSPDFKHKETGVGLWLNSAPTWVLTKLPPLKSDQNAATSNNDTMLS